MYEFITWDSPDPFGLQALTNFSYSSFYFYSFCFPTFLTIALYYWMTLLSSSGEAFLEKVSRTHMSIPTDAMTHKIDILRAMKACGPVKARPMKLSRIRILSGSSYETSATCYLGGTSFNEDTLDKSPFIFYTLLTSSP